MRRELAIQMLATARLNLAAVDTRAEALAETVFMYDDDETIQATLASAVDLIHNHALDIRRRTEGLDPRKQEEATDE